MDIGVSRTTTEEPAMQPVFHRRTATRVSRGGLDEINPDDIVYGEYSSGNKEHGSWIDLVYLDQEILRTYSGAVDPNHPVIQELKILLRSEDLFYLVPIKELPLGFAFKRTDIVTIKMTTAIHATDKNMPSCVWEMSFKDGAKRSLETNYQAYFAYGLTIRPSSMTNATILDNVFNSGKQT